MLDRMGRRRPAASTPVPTAKPRQEGADAALLNLQRSIGNAGVAHLIALQRDGGHAVASPSTTELDEQARAIVAAAQATSPAVEQRAVNAVQAIIDAYYPDKKSMVSGVHYVSSEPGLMTTAQGKGESVTGSIAVGHYFIANTTENFFARRVLQVGHELEHIQQHREGKGGEGHRHEREFLAFYHEGLNPALPHTGRVSHSTRVQLMDEAIRHYNAMPAAQQQQYADKYRELLEHRATEQRKSGKGQTEAPTERAP
jgi:hypothetical protein